MIELNNKDRRQSVRLDFVSDVIVRSVEGDKYVKGELIGGCDIMIDMYHSGELKELIEADSSET